MSSLCVSSLSPRTLRCNLTSSPPQSRINQGSYPSVSQFTEDVQTLLANAIFWNEAESPLWHDAKALEHHFLTVMREPAPLFIPPRKYDTLKRKAEAEAEARGESLIPKKRSHHRGAAEKARAAAAEKAAQAAAELAQIEAEEELYAEQVASGEIVEGAEEEDEFAIRPQLSGGKDVLAVLGLGVRRGTASPSVAGTALPVASPATTSGADVSPPPASAVFAGQGHSARPLPTAVGPFTSSTSLAANGHPPGPAPVNLTKLRPLSRLSSPAAPPSISSFNLTLTSPSAAPTHLSLSCAETRSHAFAIPMGVTRVEFAPRLVPTAAATLAFGEVSSPVPFLLPLQN